MVSWYVALRWKSDAVANVAANGVNALVGAAKVR